MSKLSVDSHFDGFVAARNKEADIRWRKVQIFFLINSALIGFIASSGSESIFKIVGCVAGLIITIIWYAIQIEAQYAIDYWNDKIAEIENDNQAEIRGFGFKYPHEGFHYKYFSTHYLILALVAVFAMGWVILLVLDLN